MSGGANNLGNITWDGASQLPGQGQGQPSTSGSQDGSQRVGVFLYFKVFIDISYTQAANPVFWYFNIFDLFPLDISS